MPRQGKKQEAKCAGKCGGNVEGWYELHQGACKKAQEKAQARGNTKCPQLKKEKCECTITKTHEDRKKFG